VKARSTNSAGRENNPTAALCSDIETGEQKLQSDSLDFSIAQPLPSHTCLSVPLKLASLYLGADDYRGCRAVECVCEDPGVVRLQRPNPSRIWESILILK